jgi:hypothetical protein
MDRFDAACLAAHLHGRAGEVAGATIGLRSALARDVVDALSAAIGEHESKGDRQDAKNAKAGGESENGRR